MSATPRSRANRTRGRPSLGHGRWIDWGGAECRARPSRDWLAIAIVSISGHCPFAGLPGHVVRRPESPAPLSTGAQAIGTLALVLGTEWAFFRG